MFFEQLKMYRQQSNMSQSKVAEMLNVTQQCYSLWEKGINEPSFDMLRKICVIFKCTTDEILEMDEFRNRR